MVQKRYTKLRHSKLTKELAWLRKGEGITPAKLHDTSIIRAIAAHATHTPPDSITDYQIYNFLLTELARLPDNLFYKAMNSAFGITSSALHLATRRKQLAQELNRHSDTVERYENKGIQDFANKLLEHESTALITPPTRTAYLQELEAQTTALRTIAAASLAAHLPLGNHADDLLRYLELSRQPYLQATVTLSFLPSSRGDEWYRYKLVYCFQGSRETFRIAVVFDRKDGERLMQAGLIDDFHQLNNAEQSSREISTIIANSKFILKDTARNTQKLLRLKALETEAAMRILQASSATFNKACVLLEIKIPPEWQTSSTAYEYHSTVNLRAAEHYAFWYSPALMYLKKLTFDFSHFPDPDRWQFFLQPFLGHNTGTLFEDERLFMFQAHSWIMPGHGIALIWQEPQK